MRPLSTATVSCQTPRKCGQNVFYLAIFSTFEMAMRFFATALIFCGVVVSNAQTPAPEKIPVPETIRFAGITLTLREDVRSEIQKDVDALTRSPKYFNIKVERARTYFPLIERIFNEERVPTDFKFLVLQESALIADAVSETNAVGFWQFKDFTASEMGLRVDRHVDERMNIVSSTRAAARYIKQNNYMFNNWVYALQAYQMGAGGVKRMVGDEGDGARSMEITPDTYWYVKKYLAHKVAFEEAVRSDGQVKISEVDVSGGGPVADIASRVNMEETQLREFNKWIRSDAIPPDRTYVLVVPSGTTPPGFSIMPTVAVTKAVVIPQVPPTEEEVMINDLPVLQARADESLSQLADRSGLDMQHFLKYNDLDEGHVVVPGGYYFKGRKRSKAEQEYHELKRGEDLWTVSQQYGVQEKRLRKLNHLAPDETPSPGTMIWLSNPRPRTSETPGDQKDVVEVGQEFMDWPAGRTDGSAEHIVRQGESLYAIARLYGTTVDNIRQGNKLESTDLQPGQRLMIVKQDAVAGGSGIIHEVQQAETLYSLAKRYGVSVQELMESNNKTDFSVALGEKLKIPAR
jgi:membrane-bound lytic murein transglycosylase D